LRGLPMQATQTQTYAAAPNPLTQGIGTVGALGSLANVFKGSSTGREGGLPSEFKSATGIKSYRKGGVSDNVEGILYDMSPKDLEDYIEETSSPIAKRLAQEVLRDKVGKAGGGIIAFQNPNEENNQGVVKEDPEMVRQAYVEAVKLQAANNPSVEAKKEFPTSVGPVNVGPTNIPSLDKVIANRQLGLPKDFPPELSYEADKARSEFQQRVIEQGGQLKPTTKFTGKSVVPMTDAQRMTGFRAALDQVSDTRTKEQIIADANKQNARVQTDPDLSKEDKARLQRRHDEGIAIVKADPNIGAKPPAVAPGGIKTVAPAGGPAAAAPNTKLEFPTTGIPALDQYFKNVLEKASKPPETVEEEIAKKEKYLGPDDSVQKERARLMSAKSNIQDEKYREFNMNAALFFAEMATKPGNVAFAALTALKNTIPTFVASDKEKGKLFREIDKGLTDLDKAARLEKSGNYDAAREIIAKRSKTLLDEVAKPIAFFQAENVAKIGLEGDRLKAKTQDATNRKQYAVSLRSDQELLRKIEDEAKKSIDYSVYTANKSYLIKNPNKKGTEEYKQKEDAVKKYEDDLETRTRPIREQINLYRKELGLDSSVDGERKKDTANNKLTMDGYVFPDQKSLDAYKAAKAKG